MAHLLIVELPGGNDVDIVCAAKARGDTFVFLTADVSHYQRLPAVWSWVEQAQQIVETAEFDTSLEQQIQGMHAQRPFDAILCLLDIRLVETALLARALGLRFLNPDAAFHLTAW